MVIFQPNGATLIVGEEYSIENSSAPPQAYFRADGNFEFALPPQAKLQQVAAAGPAGMPVVQAPIEKKDNHYAIAYAFRPGSSTVRFSYEMPYPNNSATVKVPTSYLTGRLLVVAPPDDADQWRRTAAWRARPGHEYLRPRKCCGWNGGSGKRFGNRATTAGCEQWGGNSEGSRRRAFQRTAAGANIQQVPGRLDVLKWPLVGGFVMVFAFWAFLIARKPMAVTTVASLPNAAAYDSAAPVQAKVKSALASVDAAVGNSLDGLKEKLFRLELRHQAGTISEEEYAHERARAEKVLRDLVRG